MHEQFSVLPYVHHVRQPYWFEEGGDLSPEEFGLRAAEAIAGKIDELGAENVAAFIAEPVQGAGGVIVPPDSYWPAVQEILDEREVLFISDEVICGFGRMGRWFGFEHFGTPAGPGDVRQGRHQRLPAPGRRDRGRRRRRRADRRRGRVRPTVFTWSGHPAACAAGVATLELYRELATNDYVTQTIAPYWAARLAELGGHRIVGEARSLGMLGCLELVRDAPTRTRLEAQHNAGLVCRDAAVGSGLMVRAVKDSIISAPPLVCTKEELDLLFERLLQALDHTAAHYGIN